MKEYNADILIENSQKSEDGDEVLKTKAPCKLMFKDDVAYILYKEEEATSKIKVTSEQVTVTRMGKFSNEMVYKEGETTSLLYKMPYGALDMKIKTSRVSVDITPGGGQILLCYELLFSGTKSKNCMKITINSRN